MIIYILNYNLYSNIVNRIKKYNLINIIYLIRIIKKEKLYINITYIFIYYLFLKIIKWGLGIGDWAQSPIPNPQIIISYLKLIIY